MILNLIKKYYISIGIVLILIYFSIYYIPVYITSNISTHKAGTFTSNEVGLPIGEVVRINENNVIAIQDSVGNIHIRKMPIVYMGIIFVGDKIK